jgi:hypothetical protein
MDVPNPHVTTAEMRTRFKDECWRLMNHQDHDIARFAELAEIVLKHLEETLATTVSVNAGYNKTTTETVGLAPSVTVEMDTTKQSDPAEGPPDEHSGAHF